MGTLSKNINFVWYGDRCESCEPFLFYSGISLREEVQGVLRVTDIKAGGYVYAAWAHETHADNLQEFEKLPDLVKNTLGADYLKNGQGIDRFECGHAYIVEVAQGTIVDIPNLLEVNLADTQSRRLVNPCPTCPDEADCDCTKKKFTFKKFDLEGPEFEGWEDPRDACFDNDSGIVHEMVLDTETAEVGTKLYLAERIATENFMGVGYVDDKFSIASRYVYADNKAYKINNRSIEEIIDCDDIKPTPTPTLVLDPPINEFCVVNSSIERNNGEYVLQQDEYNNRPIWKSSNNMFSYYGTPAGVSTKRWMISGTLGSNYGQFADGTGESGPYDVSWNNNKKYYHTIVRGQCGLGNLYWMDYGDCVDGERPLTRSGDAISLNKDATILAIGCTSNSDSGQFAGHTRVFRLNNNKWEQMGQDIDGHNWGDYTGSSVSLNDGGNILAVGSYLAERIGTSGSPPNQTSDIGDVRIYKWNTANNTWTPHGSPLFGDVTGDKFGTSCQLNAAGDCVVVGASGFDGDASNTGLARVYTFDDSDWVQLGQDLYGEQSSGYGTNVTITKKSNANGVVIGAVADRMCEIWESKSGGNFQRRGQRISVPSNTQAGNIATNAPSAVSINESGDRIAISIENVYWNPQLPPENPGPVGITQVYQYNGVSDWVQLGSNLSGQAESVQLSATGSTIAVSDISGIIDLEGFRGNDLATGTVSVYTWDDVKWNILGEKLYGKTHLDSFGFSTSMVMSELGEVILAVSAPGHTQFTQDEDEQLGQVCVFKSPQFGEILPTPVDCQYTQTPWTTCTQVCDPDGSGPGSQTRTTTIISQPLFGGTECPGTTVIQTCGEDRCPIDCIVSDWTWSGSCSASCGGGVETATRTILQNSQFGGSPCPTSLTTTRPCNTHICPENCEGTWDVVVPCNAPCNGGSQTLAFKVTKPAVGTGSCTDEGQLRLDVCNTQPCPVDCVGSWSDWGTCSSSCGGGKQTRTFIVSVPEQYGGVCPNRNEIETRDCNSAECTSDCEGYWNPWTSCTTSCGSGQQSRSFVVTKDEVGQMLTQDPRSTNASIDRNVPPNPSDVVYGDIITASTDSDTIRFFESDNSGTYTETHTFNPGQVCNYGHPIAIFGDTAVHTLEYQKQNSWGESNEQMVVVYKKVNGTWQESQRLKAPEEHRELPYASDTYFGQGLAITPRGHILITTINGAPGTSSSGGNRAGIGALYVFKPDQSGDYQYAQYIQPDDLNNMAYFGQSVSASGDYVAVGAHDYQISSPGYSEPLDQGIVFVYEYDINSSNYELKARVQGDDPITGQHTLTQFGNFGWSTSVWGSWLVVGAPATLNSTDQNIPRSPDANPNTHLYNPGATGAVYVYTWSGGAWKRYQKLNLGETTSDKNFGYSVSISRQYLIVKANDNRYVYTLSDSNTWELYHASNPFDQGHYLGNVSTTDTILVQSSIFGVSATKHDACANRDKTEYQSCNTQPCPTNCEGYWTDFGACDKSCGTGIQTRSFVVTKPEEHGGICPNKSGVESRNCNTQPCPTNCEGSWSSWGACSTSCNGGTQTRYYIVSRNEANGGVCPDKNKTQTQACNTQPCPTNCEGYWSSWGSCSKSCGSGTQTRSWVVTKSEANGGSCTYRNQTQTQACNSQCCPQNCEGYWTDWGWQNIPGRCSSSCGPGTQVRYWRITTPYSCGGTCPHQNGESETRQADCGCCPTNCVVGWNKGECTSEGNMSPKDNIQYVKSKYEIITPAKCGGSCNTRYVGREEFKTGDCAGSSVPSYKITGFGGTEGARLEDLIFYPILNHGNLSPVNSGNKISKGPADGWYLYSCNTYSDRSGGITPCAGNRKFQFRTPDFSPSGDTYTSYYYGLKWDYSAGKSGAYNQIWNGGFTGYRDWQIRNFNGSYRTINSQYGWILYKMYKTKARFWSTPFGGGYVPEGKWQLMGSWAWSYQLDLNNIPGMNSPFPVDGEQLTPRNYKWGLNRNPDYLNRYQQYHDQLGFVNIFGKVEKVSNLAWGKGINARTGEVL